MSETDKEFTRLLVDHVLNAKEFCDWGIKRGLTRPQDLQFTIEARQLEARKMIESGMSQREAARLLGVDHKTIQRDLAQYAPENGANVATTRKAGEDARKAILEAPADPEIIPGVFVEDFYTGSQRIADESVDLVFTDPPYDKDSVDLYRRAARVAARILKPGGSFIAYSGQKYLPEVYGLINTPALRYWWTFAGVHAGSHQMLQKLGIRCGWKPILWYVKGTRGDVSAVLSDVITGAREKSHHDWQQAESEAEHFIEKLTFPGGLVVDFFFGGGTTKIAADRLERRFIGFEIDRATAERSISRFTGDAA